jgi:hypothetical protein
MLVQGGVEPPSCRPLVRLLGVSFTEQFAIVKLWPRQRQVVARPQQSLFLDGHGLKLVSAINPGA